MYVLGFFNCNSVRVAFGVKNNLVVKTKIRQTQRNADANAEESTMAEAQMKMVTRPKKKKVPEEQLLGLFLIRKTAWLRNKP